MRNAINPVSCAGFSPSSALATRQSANSNARDYDGTFLSPLRMQTWEYRR
jgi:hypothetical protein